MQVGNSPAGIGRYITELVRAFDVCADERYEITAYTSRSARALLEWSPQRVKVVPVGGAGGTRKRILRQQFVVPKLVRGHSDIAHYPDYLTPIDCPAPCVVTIHDVAYSANPAFYTWPQRMLRQIMYPVALRAATTIVADSEFTRQEILRNFPSVPPDQIRVVYLGIAPPASPREDVCAAIRDRLRLPDRFVLSVCTREPRKNLDRLLHAFGRCPELADEYLVLVGGAGWGRDSLAVLNAYGPQLARRVLITGYIAEPELAALYRLASAFVYISLLEGFGLPPLEAMSYGVPVVASDIPVLREVLGDHALYVHPYDVDSIGAGIRTMLNDTDASGQFARRGRLHVRQFTWERCAGQMLDIYRQTAVREGRRRPDGEMNEPPVARQ